MTTSKLPSLIGMRSISKGWFSKIRVQPWITVASSGWPFISAALGQMTHLVGDSISPNGFLPSILLLLVIIVAVVIVVVTLPPKFEALKRIDCSSCTPNAFFMMNSLQSQIPEVGQKNREEVEKKIGARGDGIGDSLLVALYNCITFIYISSWEGEMVSEAKISLDKSFEESEEVFLGEAGK
ncbi:hypothetical protein Tco_0983139 [Tanacetum coccineum]